MVSLIASCNAFVLWLLQRQLQSPRPIATSTPVPTASVAQPTPQADTTWLPDLGDYFGNFFVIVIWLLFASGVLTLVRYLRKLPGERRQMERVRANFEEVLKTSETNPEAMRREVLKNVAPDSLVAARVEELYRTSAVGGDFDHVAMTEVLAAREATKTSIARYVASVLVLLGLCGAIFGLSGLVFRMGDQLKEMQAVSHQSSQAAGAAADARTVALGQSIDKVISTMSDSLAHTRGAFFASLTGILSSVVLLFLNWFVGRRQVTLLADLEALTASTLIPLFKPPSEARELAAVVDSFREGSGYLVRLSDELDDKVMQVSGSLDNLFAVVRKFGESADALQVSHDRVYEAQSHMLQVVEQFSEMTGRIEKHQAGSAHVIDEVVTAVRESSTNFTRAVEEWQKKHESLLQLTQNASRQAHQEASQTRAALEDAIRETNEAMRNSVDQQLGQLRAQSLEMLEMQQTTSRKYFADIVASNGEFVTQLRQSVADGDGRSELLGAMMRGLESDRRELAERIENALRSERQAFAEGLTLMQEQNREMAEALRAAAAVRPASSMVTAVHSQQLQDVSSLATGQGVLAGRVAGLSAQADYLGSALAALLCVICGAILSVVSAVIISIFDVWPVSHIWRVLTVIGILAGSLLVSTLVPFLMRRRWSGRHEGMGRS